MHNFFEKVSHNLTHFNNIWPPLLNFLNKKLFAYFSPDKVYNAELEEF